LVQLKEGCEQAEMVAAGWPRVGFFSIRQSCTKGGARDLLGRIRYASELPDLAWESEQE